MIPSDSIRFHEFSKLMAADSCSSKYIGQPETNSQSVTVTSRTLGARHRKYIPCQAEME